MLSNVFNSMGNGGRSLRHITIYPLHQVWRDGTGLSKDGDNDSDDDKCE